jgi:hypothetical protein
VYIGRKWIDTVFYIAAWSFIPASEVREGLIEEGYDPRIKVIKRRMPK